MPEIFQDVTEMLLGLTEPVVTKTLELIKLTGNSISDSLDAEGGIPITPALLKWASKLTFGESIQSLSMLAVTPFVMAIIQLGQKAFASCADGSEKIQIGH